MSKTADDVLLCHLMDVQGQSSAESGDLPEHCSHSFVNPYQIEDLLIFDPANLARVLATTHFRPEHLAWALGRGSRLLIERVLACLDEEEGALFELTLAQSVAPEWCEQAGHLLLDALFWELTYWQTPEMYAELVAGEDLHPGIFRQLEPALRNKTVLDVGAGCGRASFAALEHGAAMIYAVEPSPGLRWLFREKQEVSAHGRAITLCDGDFTHLPLSDRSVDVGLVCSAFTAEPPQGGDAALAELRRVTRPGGIIVLIWPRAVDRAWLAAHGFHYVALAQEQEMFVSFASWKSAWRCVRRFYACNANVCRYLRHARQPRIPFTVLGVNAPCDYCWLQV